MGEIRIAVAGGDIFCAHAGEAGPALLLLHGWTLDHRMWAPQIEAFSGSHLVICPDRRGFGRSSAPAGIEHEAEDFAHVLDRFGARNAIIVGMSQAGRVVLEFALRFPERTKGLVLHGARAGAPDTRPEIPISEYAALVRAGNLGEMKRGWSAHPLMQTRSNEAARAASAMLQSYDGRDLLRSQTDLPELTNADLGGISAPALVIVGTEDTPQRARAGKWLAQKLPNAEHAEIPSAGHLCNLCQPKAYNEILACFIARVPLTRSQPSFRVPPSAAPE
jgi:pimeloyl-ACP methyl ester carboxylesterase